MKNANPRLTRWALAIQPFYYTIVHRPGRLHSNADGLSRQSWPEGSGDMQPDLEADCFAAKQGEGSVGIPQQAATPPSPAQRPEVMECSCLQVPASACMALINHNHGTDYISSHFLDSCSCSCCSIICFYLNCTLFGASVRLG